MSQKKRVLMVCLGNSCRSPIAEALFDDFIKKLNLLDFWEVDSAALLQYHVGNDPEPRAVSVLKNRGITQYSHKAKQITKEDFYKFDWILAMDSGIAYDLCQMQPEDSQAKIELLGKYDPNGELNIRDPLFDDDSAGFEKAFEQATRSIKSFLKQRTSITRD
ncbi:low molecular weight phosphotyrosine protein phosphatase [Osmia lignaria lignaria]|uniref:low molecular weight phosphotyrosine protein phosphatase n=1 Tax=Osmia lignaria lignaria TaxID=1437193 RepID=UPI001478515D|nr:low molecular weight phosphotyrosine protein phosphatase-like [Osmia lignaria]